MKLIQSQSVYVIYNPSLNITKIGISINVNKRKCILECACGCELLLHYNTMHIYEAEKIEIKAHEYFKDKRKKGEWFNISPCDAEEKIKELIVNAIIDPMVTDYLAGVSITKIAEERNVSRQAILLRLSYYGYREILESNNTRKKRSWKAIPEKCPANINCIEERLIISEPKKEENIFLDNKLPLLPVTKLKRIEPNINFNGEWYQIVKYINGCFYYAYTQDLIKAREFKV